MVESMLSPITVETIPIFPEEEYERIEDLESGTVHRSVVLCKRKDTGELVVIKTFAESYPCIFEECLRRQALNHPNVMPCLNAWRSIEGHPMIAVPYMRYGSLNDETRAKMSGRQRMFGARGVARAIKYLHQNNILCNDLHFGNIFVRDIESCAYVVLDDFGTGRLYRGYEEPLCITAKGRRFAAPERRRGGSEKADIFSLGVLIHFLLVGDWPRDVDGSSITEDLKGMLENTPWLGTAEIVGQALRRDPNNRPRIEDLIMGLFPGMEQDPTRDEDRQRYDKTMRRTAKVYDAVKLRLMRAEEELGRVERLRLTNENRRLLTTIPFVESGVSELPEMSKPTKLVPRRGCRQLTEEDLQEMHDLGYPPLIEDAVCECFGEPETVIATAYWLMRYDKSWYITLDEPTREEDFYPHRWAWAKVEKEGIPVVRSRSGDIDAPIDFVPKVVDLIQWALQTGGSYFL